ncbi:MAG: transposase [Myxococcales bacterium]|nr:transposase [Myxococcales bacterium]
MVYRSDRGVVRNLFETDGPGRPPKYSRRQLLDACVYVLCSSSSWRMLSKDFPPWQLVYGSFRRLPSP